MRAPIRAQTTRMKPDAAHMPMKANMRDDNVAADITENNETQDETPAPLRRRKAHIRESNEMHLLACAEAVFAERGLDGTSTAMIAERAGLPKANVHYYFPTKLALYRRVLEDLFEDWHRAADTF
jgi:TetR/AcrR family transcriptional regulator